MHRDHARAATPSTRSDVREIGLENAAPRLFCGDATTICSRLAIGLICPGSSMAEPRSGIDLSAIDPAVRAAAGFLAIRQWQMAGGDADPGRPQRLEHFFGAARNHPAAIARGDRGHRSQQPRSGSETRKLADLYGSFMNEARRRGGRPRRAARRHWRASTPSVTRRHCRRCLRISARLWVRLPLGARYLAGRARCDGLCRASGAGRARIAGSRLLSQGRRAFPDHPHRLSRPHRQIAVAGRRARGGNSADGIIALETALARLQWTRVENRDPIKTYNKTEIAALPALLANDDWPSYLAAAGVGARHPYAGCGAAELFRRPRRGDARHTAGSLARLSGVQSAQQLRALSRNTLCRRGFRVRTAHAAGRARDAAALEARHGDGRPPDRIRARQALRRTLLSAGQQGAVPTR